ncbi:MAG: hypothetical protein PHN38_01045 [Sulfurospirillaceae bacterium]|nr:hypothetical protein [Sulfurospirillaceae bacterium]MDD3462452.1 hypothetical protein [Sulfurospirillaceae bacterium]
MTTYFLGQIDEVRPTQRKNKDTGVVTMSLLVTVTSESKDKNGYLIKSTQDIQFDMNEMANLTQAKGKFILVPYLYLSTKGGNFMFPNDDMGYQIYDKNPLDVKKIA